MLARMFFPQIPGFSDAAALRAAQAPGSIGPARRSRSDMLASVLAMPAVRQRLLLSGLALALAALLAGCGKTAELATTSGPSHTIAPLSRQGAVSVSTRNTTRLGGADEATDAASVARTVYPGLTSATRPALVLLVDERNWPAALAAASLASAPTGAPILYSEGNSLPEVSRLTLEAMHPQGSTALGGTQVVRIGTTASVPAGLLARTLAIAPTAVPAGAAGSSAALAAATNAAASTGAAVERLLLSADGTSPPHQVIVVPANAAPAMTTPAAGLAAESGAPILFAGPTHVPKATAEALAGLHRPSIYVIDPARLSGATLAALRHFGSVTTISAPSSTTAEPVAANAVAIARFTDGTFGWGIKEPGHGLVFANAARPLDGPGSALLSASADYGPLLLLESPTRIPAQLAAYLGDIQPAYNSSPEFRPDKGVYNHGWLIGDEAAISAVTQSELDALLEISPSKQPTSEEPAVSQVE